MQEILSGKRRLLSMGWPRFPSLAATTLTPILTPTLTPVLTPVQRISACRKFSSTHRVITHRQKQRLRLEALTEQLRFKMIAEVPTRLQTSPDDGTNLFIFSQCISQFGEPLHIQVFFRFRHLVSH